MSSYETLAGCYDALTEDVAYQKRADFVEKLLRRSRIPVHTVLDLACGTGSMTCILTERGYEMIAVDGSEDMLAAAREKAADLAGEPPLFLHQEMPRLDLYGTVDAAICCLDSLNYLTSPRDVQRTLQRLRLFIAPGGALVFDVSSPEKLRGLDGQVFLDETEDVFTRREDGAWDRGFELHRQRSYEVEELKAWLLEAGFTHIRTFGDCRMRPPREGEDRIYFCAIRGRD